MRNGPFTSAWSCSFASCPLYARRSCRGVRSGSLDTRMKVLRRNRSASGIAVRGVVPRATCARHCPGSPGDLLPRLPLEIRRSVLFVADSKMVTQDAIDNCCEFAMLFVSRLPNTFGLERATKAAVRECTDWDEGSTFASSWSIPRRWRSKRSIGLSSRSRGMPRGSTRSWLLGASWFHSGQDPRAGYISPRPLPKGAKIWVQS